MDTLESTHDIGHQMELVDDSEAASDITSNADSAKGMIIMGGEGERSYRTHVAMAVDGGKMIAGDPAVLLSHLLPDLSAMICPPTWWYFESYWPD